MARTERFGESVLHLGDCRDVLPQLLNSSIDMLWTDPPYGNSNHEGDFNSALNVLRGLESQPIANDDQESMRAVVNFTLTEAARFMRRAECTVAVCCSGGGGSSGPSFAWLADRMNERGLQFFHSVIWDKANPGLGWRYRRQYEMVMIAHRADGKIGWGDADRAVPNIYRACPSRERAHPNEKPLSLVEWFVANHTVPGQVVIDPFMGSGTTGVACANLGRAFIGVELELRWFDAACRRIEEAYKQPRLFVDKAPLFTQGNLLEGVA